MPLSVQLETSYLKLKYDSTEGWNFTVDTVERAKLLQVRATSMKELILPAVQAGLTVAHIGVTIWHLFRLGINALAWLPNCLIFQVTIPSDKKDIFNKYVTNELANELTKSFSEVRNLLQSELRDDFSKIPPEVLESLEKTKISEATICDYNEVRKAKEAALAMEAKKAPPPHPTYLIVEEDHRPTSLLAFYDKPKDGDIDGYIVTAKCLEDDDEKVREVSTEDTFARLHDLKPGQTYVLWVQSVKGEIRSEKCFLRDSVRIALFGPAVEDYGSDTKVGTEMTDLRIHLRNVFPLSTFSDERMEKLLSQCSDMGIVEARDLKFLGNKNARKEMNETLKPVEIEKLLDNAQEGQRSINNAGKTATGPASPR